MRPKKSLGQNFLQDTEVINRIVDAIDLQAGECVVEIGPGRGALTEILLEKAARVVAIEFDRDLIGHLDSIFGDRPDFKLIADDALKIEFAEILNACLRTKRSDSVILIPSNDPVARADYPVIKLVANLPYNISTPILQRLIEQRAVFSSLVLMFQREVAERITAVPGGKERGFLSVLMENAFDTEYLFDVAPAAFYPIPKVWSAVLRLIPKTSNVLEYEFFRQIVSASFAQKRKTILNNLKVISKNAGAILKTANIDGIRRAETLTLEEWYCLTNAIGAHAVKMKSG